MQLEIMQGVPGGDNREDTAAFSDDAVYRWWLTRHFDNRPPVLRDEETFAEREARYEATIRDRPLIGIGLNPSTATATKNDQTITKDIGFARRWGCGWFGKVNAYGYRATDPADMKRARKRGVDIVGPDNDRWLRRAFEIAVERNGIILVAWGAHIEPERQCAIAELLDTTPGAVPMCLGTNDNGTPKHELYIPYERELVPWRCP